MDTDASVQVPGSVRKAWNQPWWGGLSATGLLTPTPALREELQSPHACLCGQQEGQLRDSPAGLGRWARSSQRGGSGSWWSGD